MKKKIVTIAMMFVLMLSIISGTAAFAEVSIEECDRCFQTTICGLLDGDEVGASKINAERKPVYDINIQLLGYVYEFEIISGSAYAIIICDNGNYVTHELVTQSESPYVDFSENELRVYVNNMTYLKYVDGTYFDIETSAEVSAEILEAISENAVTYSSGDVEYESTSVTIRYQTRTPNAKNLCVAPPSYTSPGGIESACAAVAGSNLIGFYDRYYENLIPNHAAGYETYGIYIYNVADNYVYDTVRDLYNKMDGSSKGINETNFKKGMQVYCKEKGLTCDFTQLVTSGRLNYSGVINSINENKPVVLLLSTYNICDINGYDSSKYDRLDYRLYGGNHMMAGFGYCEINYTFSDGSNQTNRFIYVATGFAGKSEAYFNINYNTNINSAYKVYIY